MPKFKVLLTDYAWPDLDIERRVLAAADAELVVATAADEVTLSRLATDADAIMTNWARVGRPVIEAATRCRIVSRLGVGLDNIDVDAATRRGMLVTNVPDYCVIEVAEHALALILALGRKVAFYHLATKSGRYDMQAGPRLARLEGQTVGIVGFGNIGRKLADKVLGLGMQVLFTSRTAKDAPQGARRCSLEELLTESNYVSLHVPLSADTRHLIGRAQLERMKPTAYLVNTARGALVDHKALTEHLAAGRLAGAALDVHDPEPPPLDSPLYRDERVIATPHAAFVSQESLASLRERSARQVATVLSGGVPEHVVNQPAPSGNG